MFIFWLSNQLLFLKEAAKLFIPYYPISHVNHHSWYFPFIPKCENDHFKFTLWKFSKLSRLNLCEFHFDIWTKCHDFRQLTADWNFWSILTSFSPKAADLRVGKINMYVLFGSHSTLAEKNICQSGLCENQYSSQKLQIFLKNEWKSGYHFISDTGPIFQQKVQIKTTSNSENIFWILWRLNPPHRPC